MRPLRLVSLNVERSKHLERVIPFLQQYEADIICLQELCERDIPHFETSLGMQVQYAPVGWHPADPPEDGAVMTGVALLSNRSLSDVSTDYYKGTPEQARNAPPHRTATDAPLIMATLAHEGISYRIATTHFTWTPDGLPSDEQRTDIQALLRLLDTKGEFALCGDFNAPRGGEIFAELARRYTDNIPPRYATSIDVTLHKNGKDKAHELADKMVDGLFTTPGYAALGVELRFGISDHAAITADITKH